MFAKLLDRPSTGNPMMRLLRGRERVAPPPLETSATTLPQETMRPATERSAPPSTPTPALPAVGSILGKYELLSLLGRGSTSVVYEGRHRKLQIPVAVKVLHHDVLANSPQLLGQLVSEAILLAKLNHPNIVRLWDLDDDGPAPYLVLEYVQGTTLAELIERKRPVPIPFAFAVIRQAVEGLADAHKLGIVHRDVKPGNLLIGRDGVVKVADLGLAMVVGDLLSRRATCRSGVLPAGTAAYLAPEQARDPASVDFRADIYSLGATLYHAVTGRFPFDGGTSMQVILNHLQEPPVNPRQYVPDLSEEAADLIVRMLAKDPQCRVGSYDELRMALARVVGDRRAPRPLAESFLAFAAPKSA
jgi:serine/threonine protein kinase